VSKKATKNHKYPQLAEPVFSKDLNPKTCDYESAECPTQPQLSVEVKNKWILKKGGESQWTGITGLGGRNRDQGNELSDSIKEYNLLTIRAIISF
jgi:hypothetical protein